MKTYMDCGLTGEQIADIVSYTLDVLVREFVAKIDISDVVRKTREKYPEVDEKAWDAIGFGAIDQAALNELMNGEDFKTLMDQIKLPLVMAYTVEDDEDKPEE